MMPTEATLKKYAELAVKVGVNVQKEQPIFINAPIEARDFVHHVVEEAYNVGRKM